MTLDGLARLDARWSKQLRLVPGQYRLWTWVVFFAHSGDSWFWMAGLGLAWLFSWLNGSKALRSETMLLAIGVVLLALFVLPVKFTIRRQRPPGEWGGIYRNTDPHSFPSGHAARAFMLAVIVLSIGPTWFGLLLLLWAPLVCLARVATGVHYLSDVVAGMLLGILAGFLMLAAQPFLVSVLFRFF